jgi:hypothetical protein
MRLKSLVLMLTTSALLTSSCSSTPPPKPTEPEPAYKDSRLTTWDDECEKGEEWSKCPNKTLSWIYHMAVDLAHDLAVEKVLRKTADQRWQTVVDEKDADLDKWYRKWYIIGPLFLLAGMGVGFGVGFGK